MADADEYDYLFKVVVVGDSNVGKSQLILRYTTNQFNENTKATIGVSFGHKTIKKGEELIQAQIWDTAGQERFRSITPGFYRGTHGALLVYSITDRKSFDDCTSWMQEIQKQTDCVVMLVGNKSDLDAQRVVQASEGKAFAQKNNMLFIETSAKTSDKVDAAFEQLVGEIFEREKKSKTPTGKDEDKPTLTTGQTIKVTDIKPDDAPADGSAPPPAGGGCRC
eukprot:TRINITY_DN2599_c0_g1_i1.p1 TRINITY_DN2599_c0_g1~~TRINITY_DN2599_c0_g1_i1.p1  ORF type:complete len:222 (-),score=66.01 TRINITY_DN2599_c0_g1_i1:62-727(-)